MVGRQEGVKIGDHLKVKQKGRKRSRKHLRVQRWAWKSTWDNMERKEEVLKYLKTGKDI